MRIDWRRGGFVRPSATYRTMAHAERRDEEVAHRKMFVGRT